MKAFKAFIVGAIAGAVLLPLFIVIIWVVSFGAFQLLSVIQSDFVIVFNSICAGIGSIFGLMSFEELKR